MGLKTDIEHLSVEVAGASPDEAAALELPEDSPVTRVSRVLLIDGEAAAWMIDVLPADLVAAGIIRRRRPTAIPPSSCSCSRTARSIEPNGAGICPRASSRGAR